MAEFIKCGDAVYAIDISEDGFMEGMEVTRESLEAEAQEAIENVAKFDDLTTVEAVPEQTDPATQIPADAPTDALVAPEVPAPTVVNVPVEDKNDPVPVEDPAPAADEFEDPSATTEKVFPM